MCQPTYYSTFQPPLKSIEMKCSRANSRHKIAFTIHWYYRWAIYTSTYTYTRYSHNWVRNYRDTREPAICVRVFLSNLSMEAFAWSQKLPRPSNLAYLFFDRARSRLTGDRTALFLFRKSFVNYYSAHLLCNFSLTWYFIAGFLGKASRYTPINRRSLHLHQRPAFRSTALPSQRRVDVKDTISPTQGLWNLRVPNINDTAYRPPSLSNYSRWVGKTNSR